MRASDVSIASLSDEQTGFAKGAPPLAVAYAERAAPDIIPMVEPTRRPISIEMHTTRPFSIALFAVALCAVSCGLRNPDGEVCGPRTYCRIFDLVKWCASSHACALSGGTVGRDVSSSDPTGSDATQFDSEQADYAADKIPPMSLTIPLAALGDQIASKPVIDVEIMSGGSTSSFDIDVRSSVGPPCSHTSRSHGEGLSLTCPVTASDGSIEIHVTQSSYVEDFYVLAYLTETTCTGTRTECAR